MPVHNGYTYNYAHSASLEELAGTVWNRSHITPGIGFARKERTAKIIRDTPKGLARQQVVDLFASLKSHNERRPLRVLTMPGLHWKFERALSGLRQTGKAGFTTFYSVENEAPIYRASIQHMPGFKHHNGFGILDPFTVYSKWVYEYKFMDIERYIDITPFKFDAAWLDFTGFITPRRVEAAKQMWSKSHSAMVITLLEARQSTTMTNKIAKAGNIENYLANEINATPITVHRYVDGVPMVQITWVK